MRRSVHFVGSVPFADSGTVLRETAEVLADLIARMPDVETGARGNSSSAPESGPPITTASADAV